MPRLKDCLIGLLEDLAESARPEGDEGFGRKAPDARQGITEPPPAKRGEGIGAKTGMSSLYGEGDIYSHVAFIASDTQGVAVKGQVGKRWERIKGKGRYW